MDFLLTFYLFCVIGFVGFRLGSSPTTRFWNDFIWAVIYGALWPVLALIVIAHLMMRD
jgi:hypothetical protein